MSANDFFAIRQKYFTIARLNTQTAVLCEIGRLDGPNIDLLKAREHARQKAKDLFENGISNLMMAEGIVVSSASFSNWRRGVVENIIVADRFRHFLVEILFTIYDYIEAYGAPVPTN